VHTYERWIELARELVDLEPDWISLKDATGIMMPFDAYRLIRGIREAAGGKIPVLLYNHDMSGKALVNHLMAIHAGAEMLDTVMSPLAFGSSHPATESVVAALQGTPFDTGIDLRALDEVADLVKEMRRKYTHYETEYAGVNSKVLIHKLPGGMISNMVAQLAEAGAGDRMNEALEEIPRVSEDLGFPPLLTPSSQIVGVQAVLNVIQKERYRTITREVRDYVSGLYGRPPGPLSPELAKAVLGETGSSRIDTRPGDLADPGEWDKAVEELGDLGESDEETLLYILFPMQARDFLTAKREGKLPEGPVAPPVTGDMAPVDFELIFHGEKYKVSVEAASSFVDEGKPRKYYISVDGRLEEIQLKPKRLVVPGERAGVAASEGNGIPKASLPGDASPVIAGKVVKILVEEGDTVDQGQTVASVEAMKRENEVLAPVAGVVQRIFAKRGDSVETEDALLRIES
jgi:pyruvate carboxylase subunit B